jgi:large subunit ribosomal protein L9
MTVKRNKLNVRAVGGSTNTSVEILLAEDVHPLGLQGDIVRVKPGYARNYLLPQGLAAVATEENKLNVEKHRQRLAERKKEKAKETRKLADTLREYSVTLEANANKEGVLFGSIVERDISDALKAAGFKIEPSNVKLEGPLKQLAMYTVKLKLQSEIETSVKVWVVPTREAQDS